MAKKPFVSPVFRSRPLLNVAQVIFLLVIVGAIIVAIDLNRRAQAGRLVGSGEEALRLQVEGEATRQVELKATLDYVVSDDYVAAYARSGTGSAAVASVVALANRRATADALTPVNVKGRA